MTAPLKARDERRQARGGPRGPTSSCAFGSALCLEGDVNWGYNSTWVGGQELARSVTAEVLALCFVPRSFMPDVWPVCAVGAQ